MTNICILATGGTIDKVHDPIAEALIFSERSLIPQILEECRVRDVSHYVLMLKDSRDMTDADREVVRAAILSRPETAIVITHGTSTMPVTAKYLQQHIKDKTIVLTGAMRPFSFFQSDAGFNLGGAIAAAQSLAAGVYIYMNGQVFQAGKVMKDEAKGIFVELD